MVEGLKRAGNNKNWLQALIAIPRNVRNLYPHAFQSYIWNKVISRRFLLHGTKLVEGDLVEASDEHYEVINSSNISKFSVFDLVVPIIGSSFR